MSTRNERKRAAKARRLELLAAQEQALTAENAKRQQETHAFNKAREEYVSRVTDAMRHHKAPTVRLGAVVRGKFVPGKALEPAKRILTLNQVTGKLVERRKRYI